MSSSHVTVSPNAKTVYDELKKMKKYRYIIYCVKDNSVIDVESTGERNATYTDFLNELERFENDCRYVVFDFPTKIPVAGSQNTMTVDRLISLNWCSETASAKQKMLYSTSFNALREALLGIYKHIDASELDEVSEERIEECFKKGAK